MEPPNGITVLPNGQWVVTGDTHLGKWALEHGNIITDPHLFKWLRPYVAGASTIWDIGANIGDHTRQYLDWGKQVVAIEPNPLVFACLTKNCPEAICLNAAASDTAGEPLRFMRLENVGASRVHPDGDILVYPVVLDDENLPAPDFVKIDVEGYEMFALRGMESTLRKHRPPVFCEINRGALVGNGHRPEDVNMFMRDLGYIIGHHYPFGAELTDDQYDLLFLPCA